MASRKFSVIFMGIAIVFSILAFTIAFSAISTSENVNGKVEVTTGIQYILKSYNGHLAVFHSNESLPYKEFDIQTDTFSEYDKDILGKGIIADSEEKIRKLIEDYTS